MKSMSNCGVCGRPLVYGTEPKTLTCAICGKAGSSPIYCPTGHYVCDNCHSKSAIEVLRQVLSTTSSSDPMAILERVMAHPAVPMHGPEHHVIVPAVLVAAVRNAGYPVPEGAVEKAIDRAGKVPGGWCGLYGDCGAAVGVGLAVSVLTGATPLTGKPRTLAMRATTFAMSRMLDDQPRCCKRASRLAVLAAVDFLKEHMGISLSVAERPRCTYVARNAECARKLCSFFEAGPTAR